MSGRRKPNLWKPEEYERRDGDVMRQGYAVCNKGMCTNLVSNPGDICAQHKAERHIDRSPRNVMTF